jgi:PAS domain S-box-containing protein
MAGKTTPRRPTTHLISVFVSAIGLLLVSVGVTYYIGLVALQNNRRLAHEVTVLQQLEAYLSTLLSMETGQRGFILTGQQEYLDPYTQAAAQLDKRSTTLRDYASHRELPEQSVEHILQLAHDKTAELEKTIQIRKEQGEAAALNVIKAGKGKRLMDSIRDEIAQLQDQSRANIQADLSRARHSALIRTITFISMTLLNVAFLFWAARQILKAIERREAAVQEANNQRTLLSTTLTSIGDAVIATDTKGTVTFLNTEAQRLTGRDASEAVGKDIAEALPITNELTGQPAENPVLKVLQVGKVVGLANHTVLLSKDGRRIPIEDSAAPVRDASGKVYGVVMVFRDVSDRRKADIARERLAAIVESSDDAIFSKTLDGTITTWNRGAQDLFGYEPSQIIGQPAAKLFPPELAEREKSTIRRVGQGEHIEHYETIGLRKDGTQLDISHSASPLRNRRGEIIGISAIARSITERKRLDSTQRELADELANMQRLNRLAARFISERDLHALLDEMVDTAIAITRASKGNLQLFNPSTGHLTIEAARGFSREWLDFFGDVRGGQDAACAQAMRLKERVVIQDVRLSPIFAGTPALKVQLKEGILAVQSSPLVNRSGELLGMLSTHFAETYVPTETELRWLDLLCRQAADLLERNRAETALHESQERTRQEFSQIESIYQAAPMGLCVLDLELRYRRINERLADINGFSREAHIGKRVHDLLPTLASQAEEALKRVLDTGDVVRFELRGETPTQPGVQRIWDERWYPIRDAAGVIIRVGVVAEEVTERKRMEAELERARADLQSHAAGLEKTVAERTADLRSSIAELEGFSYSLSHDMRAPLRTIQSFSQIIMEEAGDKLGQTEKDLLTTITSASSRLDRLIQDVLTYSRVIRSPVRPVSVNVEELIRQIIHERPELQLPKADVHIEGPLHRVLGHEAYLTQCITNYLDNAIKFVPPGKRPRVNIRAERVETPSNGSPHPGSDGCVRLWFEDNGIGIPKESQGRIFGIFERLNPDASYPGTGIGLAIVRKAAERMGGSVGVESEPREGSRFWLQLPAATN